MGILGVGLKATSQDDTMQVAKAENVRDACNAMSVAALWKLANKQGRALLSSIL